MIDYAKSLAEVEEILKHLDRENYNKIPNEILEYININKDKKYIWKYDNSKKLKEQDVCDETIAILSYINMEYLLNEEQKEYLSRIHSINEIRNKK